MKEYKTTQHVVTFNNSFERVVPPSGDGWNIHSVKYTMIDGEPGMMQASCVCIWEKGTDNQNSCYEVPSKESEKTDIQVNAVFNPNNLTKRLQDQVKDKIMVEAVLAPYQPSGYNPEIWAYFSGGDSPVVINKFMSKHLQLDFSNAKFASDKVKAIYNKMLQDFEAAQVAVDDKS